MLVWYDEKIMNIRRKIMAGIALIVVAIVIRRYMKKEKEEK
jgi:ABC-type proline/glycine betaine transport system permease subunit